MAVERLDRAQVELGPSRAESLVVMAEVHGFPVGHYPWVNRAFAHLGADDPRYDGAASTCLIQGVTAIEPGGHIGPSYHVPNYGWSDEIAAAEPAFNLFDFNVASLDGTQLAAAALPTGEHPPVDPAANLTSTVYDVDFLDWSDLHEGTDLIVPTEAPWYFVSEAGGMFAVTMQIGIYFP